MMTDEQLIEISRELDTFLIELSMKYKVPTLSLSAITLARLMRFTEEDDSNKDFRKIMSEALSAPLYKSFKRTLQ